MRLFVSYARVDRPHTQQIIDTLDIHDVWFDQRLHSGQNWWKEIIRQLEQCDGLVYIISPNSVSSEYCRAEYDRASSLGKMIFPVLIQPTERKDMPPDLACRRFIDLTSNFTDGISDLLSQLAYANRPQHTRLRDRIAMEAAMALSQLGQSTEETDYRYDDIEDEYTELFLRDLIGKRHNTDITADIRSTVIPDDARIPAKLLSERMQIELELAEALLDGTISTSDISLDFLADIYKALDGDSGAVQPVNYQDSPGKNDFDSHLGMKTRLSLPVFEWLNIPAGKVDLLDAESDGKHHKRSVDVDVFRVSKYPVTNAQYQAFVDDPSGYANVSWWQYAPDAHQWRMKNPQPRESKFKGDELPREMVTWYEAMAFCQWLSSGLGVKVTLPTEQQWQRAAQSDDNHIYPWANTLEQDRCNVHIEDMHCTTPILKYPEANAAIGVYDMGGNVWEWCLTHHSSIDDNEVSVLSSNEPGVLLGGNFQANGTKYFRKRIVSPESVSEDIGFRIVQRVSPIDHELAA